MARTSTKKVESSTPTTTSSTTSKQPTAAEMRDWYEKNKRNIENYAKAKDASAITNLKDVTKNQTKTISSFNKETLMTYLKNISSNEKNLRNLSRYLYYRCQAYYRLILYNANMFELGARTVVPQYDLLKPPTPDQLLKDYYETLNVLDSMNLQQELLKAYITCFREDVFYGCVYYDDTSFFILPLDPDYMKINGYVNDGSFAAYMDMTYFRSRQDTLEAWGEPFTSMNKEYTNTGQKWVLLPPERGIVLKCRTEDYDLVLPVFAGMLNSIINLIDLEDISAIADAQEIYKLIFLEMETLTSAKNENEFSVSPDIMLQYFDRMINECLPDYVSAALVPGELKSISLNDTAKVNDTNKIIKSTESLFNSAGGSMLNGATISGTTAITLAIKADTEFALSALLPQTQTWLNRFLKVNFKNPAKVEFLNCSAYTKDELKKSLLESCQYGFSNILAYNTLNGMSERTTISMNYLETTCLGLVDKFRPLSSSFTTSSNGDSEKGRPVLDDDEISTDGEVSRDKRDTAKG